MTYEEIKNKYLTEGTEGLTGDEIKILMHGYRTSQIKGYPHDVQVYENCTPLMHGVEPIIWNKKERRG